MESDKEIAFLKAEIAALEAEKLRLEELKNLKLRRIKEEIKMIPRSFAAKHPILATIGEGTATVGKGAARLTARGINAYAENLERIAREERKNAMRRKFRKGRAYG